MAEDDPELLALIRAERAEADIRHWVSVANQLDRQNAWLRRELASRGGRDSRNGRDGRGSDAGDASAAIDLEVEQIYFLP